MDWLTTREVAAYLRLKERKIYDLVARGQIPCVRITGKWLFARPQIDAWLLEHGEGQRPRATPPDVIAGSHDPLLDFAVRESGSGLAVLFEGSLAGIERFAAGGALACGLHVPDAEEGSHNLALVRERFGAAPVVLLEWAWREQGLIVAPGNPLGLAGIADLARARHVARQPGAGSRLLFDRLVASADVALPAPVAEVGSETEVALAVSEGRADAGLGLHAVARQFRLDFVPLRRERYDLLVDRRAYFEPAFQRLIGFVRSAAFRDRVADTAGYDASSLGRVHFNGA